MQVLMDARTVIVLVALGALLLFFIPEFIYAVFAGIFGFLAIRLVRWFF